MYKKSPRGEAVGWEKERSVCLRVANLKTESPESGIIR